MAVHEHMLNITSYRVLGELPDLLTFHNGSPVTSPEDWVIRRDELYAPTIELQYGTMPPPPEFLEVEPLYAGANTASYLIHTGTREKPLSFAMKLVFPGGKIAMPCIVDGDMSFNYFMDRAFLSAATDHGIAWVLFDRTTLAHDIQGEGRRGQLYDTYPQETFGALGAWAWGYSRCVDALEVLYAHKENPLIDLSCIAFSGHSRGGKTAALAGALDQRAVIVNPNETCAGACGCYRIHMEGACEDSHPPHRSETLADLWHNFSFWMGPHMGDYAQKEEALPFDAHFLKAMIAPRILFVSEAAGDIWSNPVGSWMTTMAAREVYRLLNCEEHLYWYFRPGNHSHAVEDVQRLVHLIRRYKDPTLPLMEGFFQAPFPPLPYIFKSTSPD